jgi:hypothetical protein
MVPYAGRRIFLSKVLNRKLHIVETRYGKSQLEYERYSVIAVSSIYGIGILEDNVVRCQNFNFALPGARIDKLKPSKAMTVAKWNAKPQKKGCLNV